MEHKTASGRDASVLPELDDAQFRQWNELLESRIGIVIPPERRAFLATGLRTRMREIGCSDYQHYFDLVRSPRRGMPEWSVLVDRLTVHETRFFRHQESFALLREQVLPDFAERGGDRVFHAWSLGCATGEEAYSLAMLLDDELGARFGVMGTDVSQPALAIARAGRYRARRLEGVPEVYRRRYFEPEGDGLYRVSEALQQRVCFSRHNVQHLERFRLQGLDLVFCQNMLIYFERATRARILDELAGRLAPGGVIVIGPGEVLSWTHPAMERIRFANTLAFRRRANT